MRNSMRRCAGAAALQVLISRCSSTAQRTASRRLANSTRRPSPVVFDDAAPMLGDSGIAEFTANRTQRREGAPLVLAHQPRVTGNADGQNRCQPPLDRNANSLTRCRPPTRQIWWLSDQYPHTRAPDNRNLGQAGNREQPDMTRRQDASRRALARLRRFDPAFCNFRRASD